MVLGGFLVGLAGVCGGFGPFSLAFQGLCCEVPVLEQCRLQTPFVVCVALERGFEVLECIERDQPKAVEGVDYFHLV